jgi:hypothetical protein
MKDKVEFYLRRRHLKIPQKSPAKHGFSSERKKGKSKEEREGEEEGDRTSMTFKREKGGTVGKKTFGYGKNFYFLFCYQNTCTLKTSSDFTIAD